MDTSVKFDNSQNNSFQSTPRKISAYGWYVLGLPWFISAMVAVLNFSLGVTLPSMQSEIGFSTTQAGYLSSIGWFITPVLMFPMAGFANRYGVKKLFSITFIGMGIMIMIQGFSESYMVIFIARMLALSCAVGITPALSLLKQKWVPISKITNVNGIESLMNPVGQILAMSVIPVALSNNSNWHMVYIFLGCVILVFGILWFFTGKNEPVTPHHSGKKLPPAKSKISLFSALRYKEIWLDCVGVMGTSVAWTAFFTFWPTYAINELNLSLTKAGLLFTALPMGSIIASIVMPVIAKKAGVEKPFIWMWGLLLPGFYYSMLVTANPILIALGAFGAGFGAFAFVPFTMSLFYKIKGMVRPEEISVGSGMMMVFVGIGSGLGPIISSQLFQISGNLLTALKFCCIFPLTITLFGIFLPERGRIALENEDNKTLQDGFYDDLCY